MKKITLLVFLVLSFSYIIIHNSNIYINANEIELDINSKSVCLIEANTNTILYKKDENIRLAPASMTKVMTMILVMEGLKNEKIKLDEMITTPKEASELGGSQIFLSENEEMSVEDLLKSMAIASANDAAMSLAYRLGGDVNNFVKMMNDKVKDLGLENTNFMNPYGFDDDNHYTSSYDMALMSSYLINEYPDILKYTSKYEDFVRDDSVKKFWLVNTNKLVRFMDGVDGLKTGWTEKAGYCLTCTIKKDNKRFIAVAMGCESVDSRTKDIKAMLNYALNSFDVIYYKKKGDIIEHIVDVTKSPSEYNIILDKDINIIVEKGTDISKITSIVEKEKLIVYLDDVEYGKYDLVFDEVIKKKNFFEVIVSIIKEMLLG